MIHLIYIYIILNAIITGIYLGNNENDSTGTKIGMVLILIIIGSILSFSETIYYNWKAPFQKINNHFQLRFWYQFYFTEKLNSETFENLNRINRWAATQKNKNIKKAVLALNERNQFLYIDNN